MAMQIQQYPAGQLSRPTAFVGNGNASAVIQDWWLDHDGTRYHIVTVKLESARQTLVAVEPDARFGRSWFVLGTNREPIAWTYLAEKLRLAEGDRPGLAILLAAALQREIL